MVKSVEGIELIKLVGGLTAIAAAAIIGSVNLRTTQDALYDLRLAGQSGYGNAQASQSIKDFRQYELTEFRNTEGIGRVLYILTIPGQELAIYVYRKENGL